MPNHESHDLHYDSPRSSIESNALSNASPMSTSTITPSIRLLFSFISRRHLLILLLPAIFASIIAGGVAPFMTFVVGQVFDAFAHFPITPDPPQAARDALLRDVGIAALQLIGLAVGALALSSLTSCLWIWLGEANAMALRKAIYVAVSQKDLTWFDMRTTTDRSSTESSIGAGGLMAKFSRYRNLFPFSRKNAHFYHRETDEVRMASSLASGMLIQYLTTCVTCLILAFLRSWALTLVILSAVPLLIIVQGLSQGFASPLLAHEREQTRKATTIINHAVTAISTVKAFNATGLEYSCASSVFGRLRIAARKLNALWATTSTISQFVMMAMFVQGF